MRTATLVKSVVAFTAMAVGGPALVVYVTPTEEELFKKYNPDLQRRSIEGREQKIKDANEFAEKMIKYSKSDKPIWTVWKEDAERQKREQQASELQSRQEKRSIAEEMRRQRLQDGSR